MNLLKHRFLGLVADLLSQHLQVRGLESVFLTLSPVILISEIREPLTVTDD